MPVYCDGPASPLFEPLPCRGSPAATAAMSDALRAAFACAPRGPGVSRGIPFDFGDAFVAAGGTLELPCAQRLARWLVFAHAVDVGSQPVNAGGFTPAYEGPVQFGRTAAHYVLCYGDGSEHAVPMRRGREIGHWRYADQFLSRASDALAHVSFRRESAWPTDRVELSALSYARMGGAHWDPGQPDTPWVVWLYALENPHPERPLAHLRIAAEDALIVQGLSLGAVESHPLRWRERRKLLLFLPPARLTGVAAVREVYDPMREPPQAWQELQRIGAELRVDLGEIAAVTPSLAYGDWSPAEPEPAVLPRSDRVLVEYAAHAQARLYVPGAEPMPLAVLEEGAAPATAVPVAPAHRRLRLRIVDAHSGQLLAARVHAHGAAGEPLLPDARQRAPLLSWLIDDGAEYVRGGFHVSAYVDGVAELRVPLGRLHLEVSKGFEIRPYRASLDVDAATDELVVRLERVLDWRARGWVTADTHVHVLSPQAALLQGAGEDVGVTHLLASQWGERVTNGGDFDGRTTPVRRESSGDYLVRVGTENRQQNLGHISLLSYSQQMILPLCSGGPDESALGDPVEVLLCEWAQQCRAQRGIVVLPHFPGPRLESAAVITEGLADAVEMGPFYGPANAIDPYSLSDWYRYLNCGYRVPVVGGTDKMAVTMPIGLVRTYARIAADAPLTLEAWNDAVRRGNTFVTYGPLLEVSVDGAPPGGERVLPVGGATLDVEFEVQTLGKPITRVDLIRNGEVIESSPVQGMTGRGQWRVRFTASCWVALLVRVREADGAERIAAHSSACFVRVAGSELLAAADALTILRQIEGAIGFLDSVATRADDDRQRAMRLRLTAAHRALHQRMHGAGLDHVHAPVNDHHPRD